MSIWNWIYLAEDISDDDDDDSSSSGYNNYDARKDTGATRREAHEAWHAARDDAEDSGEITRSRNRNNEEDEEESPS